MTSAHGRSAVDAKGVSRAGSCGVLQGHNREVFAPVMERDFQLQPRARFAPHQGPRSGARRASGPTRSRLESRPPDGGILASITFVGRLATQPGMWSKGVVPLRDCNEFSPKALTPVRNQQQAGHQAFHRQDEPFDHGDAAVMADRAVARWFDSRALAPFAESVAVELGTTVADNVFRCRPGLCDRSSQECADCHGGRLLGEQTAHP